jgi:hypothetical protein
MSCRLPRQATLFGGDVRRRRRYFVTHRKIGMAHLGKATAKALLYVTSPLPLAPLSFFHLPNIYPFVGQLVAAFGGNKYDAALSATRRRIACWRARSSAEVIGGCATDMGR